MTAELITLLVQVGLNAALKIYATATGPDGQSVTVPLCYAEPVALDPDV